MPAITRERDQVAKTEALTDQRMVFAPLPAIDTSGARPTTVLVHRYLLGMGEEKRGELIARAKADLDAGKPWLARDRLAGGLAHSPADQALLDLLANVWLELGDEAQAGRFWFLVQRDDVAARQAREVFRRAHDDEALQIANALKVRAPLSAWPESVRRRLIDLASEVETEGRWSPGDRPPRPWRVQPPSSRLASAVLAVAMLLAAGVWLYGLYALIRTFLF